MYLTAKFRSTTYTFAIALLDPTAKFISTIIFAVPSKCSQVEVVTPIMGGQALFTM